MSYLNVKCEDLLAVLTQDEINWVTTVRIPYISTGDAWYKKHHIDSKIVKAITDGVIQEIPREIVVIQRGPQIIGDYIAGPGGALQNQADGKMYDSKSAYYKAVKAAGCVVMGNDAPTTCKEPEYKICEKELKRDISEAIQQLGG